MRNYNHVMKVSRVFFVRFPFREFLQSVTSSVFHLNEQYILNTHIYHHISPTYFGVRYTFLRQNIMFLVQIYAFCNVVMYVVPQNIQHTLL
jgi:hypothetical protein